MPCSDITEMIRVTLNEHDTLESYEFVKKTCGQGVGLKSLLLDQLRGATLDEILALTPEIFLESYPVAEPIEEFLGLKHLFAVQAALEVLTGAQSGGPEDLCAAAEIVFDGTLLTVEGRIRIDLVTERIKSCGGCKSCGTRPRKRAPIFN